MTVDEQLQIEKKQDIVKILNKGLVDLYKTVKQQNDSKPENLEEQLYYPEVYDIQARTPKDNKLLELEKENNYYIK